MKRTARFAYLIGPFIGILRAQGPNAPVSFEAATIRAANPSARSFANGTSSGGPGTADPERVVYSGVPVRTLLMQAYGVSFSGGAAADQIAGPAWLDNDRFDIVAKGRPGATREQVNGMLQNLLVDRFGLKIHRETKQVRGYELTQAKGGVTVQPTMDPEALPPAAFATLPPTREENGYPVIPPGLSAVRWYVVDNGLMHGTGRSQSIADIILGVILTYLKFDAPVVDQTGLAGKYDFHLDLALDGGFRRPGGPPLLSDEPTGPDIFAALDKQLGLKLEKKQFSIETLVVDQIERVPKDN